MAPLSYSFIGGYLLNPYIAQFEEAINLAATRHDEVVSVTPTQAAGPKKHYSLVKAKNVGYTGLLLFARDPTRIHDIQEAEVGFGAAEMGNKGAVGLRAMYDDAKGKSTELTFVATHLAAMEWNLPRRNANWAAIMRGMTFENPEEALESFQKSEAESMQNGESARLLHDDHDEQHARLQRKLHDMSVFKPSSHLFVAGDLNYRISTTSPPVNAPFPSLDSESEYYYPTFFPLDQLTRERKAGRTLHGLSEADVNFPPTYKYDVQPAQSKEETDVPWSFAPHRYPSWTDRVLYLDVPAGLRADTGMRVRAYDAMPVIRTSDHRPVYLRVDVPLVSPEEMRAAAGGVEDPRVRLPVEIDPEAWERRAAARRKEVMAGWSMFLWSTQQGAWILASLALAGGGAYCFSRWS